MDGTIKENICFGEESIDLKKLDEVIKITNLKYFIDSLKNGINTNVGENGKFISGGEKQRICIARSLYFDKKILIFDEPTSSLDKVNEIEILKCINSIKNKLIIFISHNKNNFENFDKIYKLHDKKLILQD